MEVPKKRKRDVDCPRITYDTSTKVFDRLFKEESLEEMKNVVRKKLGLSSSLPVHLSQLRDGKMIVLEDDDDFDAFYAFIHLTSMAKIKVYFGNEQPSRAGSDADFTGVPMQLMGSPNIHHAAADDDDQGPPKKRRVSFVESTPQPVGDNVEDPDSNQTLPISERHAEVPATLDVISAEGDSVKEPNSTLPNSEPPPEVRVALDAISADAEGAHETSNKTKKRKTGNTTGNRKKGKIEGPISEDQSLGEKVQSDIAVVTRKDAEESQRHSPSIGQADPSGDDVSTRPPTKKVRMEVVIVGKESNATTPIAATSNSTAVVKQAKKQDPKPTASSSALETVPPDSKGKTKMPSNSKLRKALTKKSRKKEEPVEPPEGNDKDETLRSSATRAAVDAILGKFLSNNDRRETATRSSPLLDATALPPPNAPVTSGPSPDDQPVPLSNTNPITEQLKTVSKCPVCDKTPYHLRSRCPIIKADDNDEEREKIIEELQRIIDKRTKSNQTRARENKSKNVKSMADKSGISPTLAADSSSVIKAPKTSRIQHPSSEAREEEEEEEEEEASPFMRSIIPLPTTSASELLNEGESSRSEDLQGATSFQEVNDLGSSMEVDKTGDDAVNDAYALDFAHLSASKPSENGHKASKSDTIETFEKPKSPSPQSPIVSIEDDIHPRQSTPKTDVAGRTGRQRVSSSLVRKPSGFTFKPQNTSRTINGIKKNSKSTKKTGSLSRITDLPVPIISNIKSLGGRRAVKKTYIESSDSDAVHPEETFGEEHEEHQKAAQPWVETQEADEQGPMDASRAIPKTRTKTPAKVSPVPLTTKQNEMFDVEHEEPQKAAQPWVETQEADEQGPMDASRAFPKTPTKTPAKFPPVPLTTKRNADRSLASWDVLEEGNSLAGNGSPGMDELRYSSDTQRPVSPSGVNGVSNVLDPLFLHSESQQSFPYSQYPNARREPPDSEDEEDEVQASVVKPRASTAKFRSLTEIAKQPALFTPTMRHPTPNNSTKDEVINLYGRANKGDEEEESSDSDTESESDAKARKSHIPMSRRAGVNLK